jgi:hypothetical protein
MPIVQISGTLASIYHDHVRISDNQVSYCSCVSFAGTTLRLQKIVARKTSIDITDIAFNVNLIRSLIPVVYSKSIEAIHSESCVRIKACRQHLGGASITVGKHGGLQYVSQMDQTHKVYNMLCSIIKDNMQSNEFRSQLTRAHYMNAFVFPIGESRDHHK